MKKVDLNLTEVKAEMLLHYLHPEMDDKWTVEHQGAFYRNYNVDLIGYDEESGEVQLARDSFTKLLPSGMLFPANLSKGKERQGMFRKMREQTRLLKDTFQPLDNFSFQRRMRIECLVSDLLDDKLQYVLKTYFHYDLDAEQNEYVKQVACLLPLVREIKGDFKLIRNILATLFSCEVTYAIGRYSDTDQTRSWLPMVTYELLIEELTPESYEQISEQAETLRQFIAEWFIPFNTLCFINVKWHHQGMEDTQHWLLDYNTELKD